MSTILKVDDINVYYGSIHAIKGISFEVNEGEIVTLIGQDGDEQITADELASLYGTIGYEVVCGISKRVPRIYVD